MTLILVRVNFDTLNNHSFAVMNLTNRNVEATIRRLDAKLPMLRQAVQRPKGAPGSDRLLKRSQFAAPVGAAPSRVDLERILGTNDLLDMNYFERGLRAARSVGRIIFISPGGREAGFATGFMVSPRLMLTNQHVFGKASDAESAELEFDYQLDVMGKLKPTERFRFSPGEFFWADAALDFALVAVNPSPRFGRRTLADFAWLPMNATPGKVSPGEFVSLIQHPGGQPKQLAVRENRLVSMDEEPPMLTYLSDTAPGSSGSPVFNDAWQVVGLHHSGVPKRNSAGQWIGRAGQVLPPNAPEEQIVWLANEGIRISAIIKAVRRDAPRGALLDEFQQWLDRPSQGGDGPTEMDGSSSSAAGGINLRQTQDGMLVTVPLSFRVQWSGAGGHNAGTSPPGLPQISAIPQPGPLGDDGAVDEVKVIDKDFASREERGYEPQFLGTPVPLPTLSKAGLSDLAPRTDGVDGHELRYYHYSVVMNKARRLCFFAASNYDAEAEHRGELSRKALGKDKWDPDPRIALHHQVRKQEVYDGTEFDLGHIVRREDNYWGETEEEAQFANWDTFFYTNCTPQHSGFNQSASKEGGLWGDLENYVAKQMKRQDGKSCQFAGPVFSNSDPVVGKGKVKIPKQFWKVIVVRDETGVKPQLKSFGFLLSQAELIKNKEATFVVDSEFAQYHVPLALIEELTEVRFGKAVLAADAMKGTAPKKKAGSKAISKIHESAVLLAPEALTSAPESVAAVMLAPGGDEIDRAVLMALASQAAYGDGQSARAWAAENGMERPEIFDIGNIQGFWCKDGEAAVLCFRGTSNIGQWVLDAKFATASHPWGPVHSGFQEGLGRVGKMLENFAAAAADVRHVWITGHSLGGGLAVLAGSWLLREKSIQPHLLTFGQPMAGGAKFAAKFDAELPGRLTRIINQSDIVPKLPPFYHHCGKGRVIVRPGVIGSESTGFAAGQLADAQTTSLTEGEFKQLQQSIAQSQGASAVEKLPGFLVPDIFEHHFIENYVKELKAIRDA